MADISLLSRLVSGIQRNVDISANTLVMSSLKLGTSELTKAKLDLLAITADSGTAVDASAQHHHDGRYFTETELGSTANGSAGASLIGVDQTPAFTNISGADIQAIIESIDTALDTAGGTVFADDVFRVQDQADATKQIALEASAITTGTTRTITMPDANVDLGEVATNTTHSSGDGSDHQDVADLATLSGVAANSTDLGTFTGAVIPDSSTIKAALQSLESKAEANTSLISNFEWQESALDFVTDNTAVPATEVSGDRYILSDAGGAPNAAWDGASAGDIVEFNGTIWVAVTPTVGTFISVDDEPNVLYLFGGSTWSSKAFEATTASTGLTKVGFDVRLADASLANGIVVSSGAISLSLASDPGLEFSTNALRAKVDIAGGANLASVVDRNANGLGIRVDDSSIEDDGNGATAQLRVKALGVTNGMLAGSIDDGKLSTITTANKVSGSAVQLSGDGTLADDTGLEVVSAPKTLGSEVAGETMPASGPVAVRYGVLDLDTPETAGRVYKADPTELSLVKSGGNKDPFHVAGLAIAAAQAAAAAIDVVKSGPITATAHGFAVGEPVYLSSAGVLTSTAPSAAGEASVKVGVAKDVNTIDVQIQIMGVN